MKIALIATHHAEYVANLAYALARQHEVLLIVSRRNAARQLRPCAITALKHRLTLASVPHHYAPFQPLIARMLRWQIEAFAPDIVHVQEHPTRSTGMLADALDGRWPLVATIHDPEPHSGDDQRAATPFLRWNERLRRAADRLIVHGDRLVEAMACTQADGARRVRTAAHGPLRFGEIAEPWEENPLGCGLIFFGRMNRYKGLDVLLAANERWRSAGFAPRLIVAGEGPELTRWRARIRTATNIECHDRRLPQAELAALVRSSAAAVLPYHDATGSGVAASAVGVGRPLLASDVGALGDAVEREVSGLLVPPGDEAAFAAAGHRLLTEPGLLTRLAQGARAATTGPRGWTAIAAHTASIYADAAAEHARSGIHVLGRKRDSDAEPILLPRHCDTATM